MFSSQLPLHWIIHDPLVHMSINSVRSISHRISETVKCVLVRHPSSAVDSRVFGVWMGLQLCWLSHFDLRTSSCSSIQVVSDIFLWCWVYLTDCTDFATFRFSETRALASARKWIRFVMLVRNRIRKSSHPSFYKPNITGTTTKMQLLTEIPVSTSSLMRQVGDLKLSLHCSFKLMIATTPSSLCPRSGRVMWPPFSWVWFETGEIQGSLFRWTSPCYSPWKQRQNGMISNIHKYKRTKLLMPVSSPIYFSEKISVDMEDGSERLLQVIPPWTMSKEWSCLLLSADPSVIYSASLVDKQVSRLLVLRASLEISPALPDCISTISNPPFAEQFGSTVLILCLQSQNFSFIYLLLDYNDPRWPRMPKYQNTKPRSLVVRSSNFLTTNVSKADWRASKSLGSRVVQSFPPSSLKKTPL